MPREETAWFPDLVEDLSKWAREHPYAEFRCADDPPFFGWMGFYTNPLEPTDEVERFWMIHSENLPNALWKNQTRQQHLEQMIADARGSRVVTWTGTKIREPRTLWERLVDEDELV